MTAHFPAFPTSDGVARARRARHETYLVALCWIAAVAGLAGSYTLEALVLQAGACLLGLAAVVAALLLMVAAERG